MNDELIYVIDSSGDVACLDHQELEEYIDLHPNEDFVIHRVREDVIDYVEATAQENMLLRQDITKADIKAMAYMTNNWGDLQMEVLMKYTKLIKWGMSPQAASYAALLSYDISVEGT